MTTTSPAKRDMHLPPVTGRDARIAILERSVRATVPLRKTFVQANAGKGSRHGPLRKFVTSGDLRGLKAYLLIVAACSDGSKGWSTTHDSAVWARLMDIDTSATPAAARTGAWRTLQRLQKHKLITCTRPRGSTMITATLLREDGSGEPYDRPTGKTAEDRFLQIPQAFWKKGFDEQIDIPGLAMLLVIAREKPWSPFPAERAPEWYGWSADTHLRGLNKLIELDLAERRETYTKAPLSPSGLTMTYQYNLKPIMRPRKPKKQTSSDKTQISSQPSPPGAAKGRR
ncbi:hypothetical protein ACFXAS_14495 [Streptomyces sp. NPDC059459]|uniref:hypothetical protein n=1 Tax=Streptomyces sp. NPDC059459 TaxID=3346839 RepID=UPI0036BDBFEB